MPVRNAPQLLGLAAVGVSLLGTAQQAGMIAIGDEVTVTIARKALNVEPRR
ncbi:hypothetical protein [Halomicronema sp. CCY15110]|uniref:hypothetical protein n=1 Tax=Halomicronema sp. CCY15110 TaxID=2767773 RepID=UPI00194E9EC7|nr:hypothetical protein [Halomicronema sp. CCY15110]